MDMERLETQVPRESTEAMALEGAGPPGWLDKSSSQRVPLAERMQPQGMAEAEAVVVAVPLDYFPEPEVEAAAVADQAGERVIQAVAVGVAVRQWR